MTKTYNKVYNILMWTVRYSISQIFVLFAIICLASSYFAKNKKLILILNLLSTTLYGLEYLLLREYTGFLTDMIGVVRVIWIAIDERFKSKHRYTSLVALISANLIGGILTYGAWYSFLPIVAGIMFTVALWQKNVKVYRYLMAVAAVVWLLFNICCLSIIGMIGESILLITSIIGVAKLYIKKGKENEIDKCEIHKVGE